MKTLTFSFDFLSPYAYLAAEGIEALADRQGYQVIWRPVLLAGLLNHNKQLGPAEIPDKRSYLFRHISRLSADLNLPMQPPQAHPFNPLLALRVACLKPHSEIILPIFRACWTERQAIDSQESLKALVDEETLVEATADRAKQLLRENTQKAIKEGVFGVPSMTVGSEVFWGLDSFAHLERFLAGKDPIDLEELKKWESLPASASRR